MATLQGIPTISTSTEENFVTVKVFSFNFQGEGGLKNQGSQWIRQERYIGSTLDSINQILKLIVKREEHGRFDK